MTEPNTMSGVFTPAPLPEIKIVDGVADQEEISQERVNAMSQDERMAMLSKYRDVVREHGNVTITLNGNSLRILRSLRQKSVADNPRAKKGAKKTNEAAKGLDLSLPAGLVPKKEA